MKSRKLYFRLLAVLLGLSVFPLFEGICRLSDWGAETLPTDAFAEFSGNRSLFTMSPDGSQYNIAADRRLYFANEWFPAVKAPHVFRIFVFGGSTVQGRPFSIPTSFGTFLKIGLEQAAPNREWQVINCGGISYASYRLLPVMEECVKYQPDLFIVCTGHNEFLECVTYSEVISALPAVKHGHAWLNQFRSFRLLQRALLPAEHRARSSQQPKMMLPDEVDAVLDHQGGLDAYTRSALHTQNITAQFGRNLQRMVEISRAADLPLMMLCPPSNLCDCPPFKSEFGDATEEDIQQAIRTHLKAASELQRDTPSDSIELLKETTELDGQFAFSWYQLGRSYQQSHRIDEAKAAFERARDEDVCPLRMTSALRRVMQRVVADNTLLYLDLQVLMEELSRQGLVGDSVLIDHIHPSFRSNQQIALALIGRLRPQLQLEVPDGWQQAAQEAFGAHLQSLDDVYFQRGRQTLQNLEAWTSGRGDGPPLGQLPSNAAADRKE